MCKQNLFITPEMPLITNREMCVCWDLPNTKRLDEHEYVCTCRLQFLTYPFFFFFCYLACCAVLPLNHYEGKKHLLDFKTIEVIKVNKVKTKIQ